MTQRMWVLVDDRTGNANQAIGLAEAFNQPFQIKKLKYNILANLPNMLVGQSILYINEKISDHLTQPWPDIVVSAGRRTAPVALWIKKQQPLVKLIQIMRPNIYPEKFDLILLPQHDKYPSNANLYWTIGAINRIKLSLLQEHKQQFIEHYPQSNGRIIAVIIGGNSKNYIFSKEDAQQLLTIIEQLSYNHAAQLFISFSRRTPEIVKQIFRQNLNFPHQIYDPMTGGYNPYLGMLAIADFVITTGDSISICSDVASTGKPHYIFIPDKFNSVKHNYFIQQLMDFEMAQRLKHSTQMLSQYQYTALHEADKAVKYIQNNIL